MSKITNFRRKKMREENSSGIPTRFIYGNTKPVFKLLSADQIALNSCKTVKLEFITIWRQSTQLRLFPLKKKI